MTSVSASGVLTASGLVGPARVSFDDGFITAVELVDRAPERVLTPGFVDLQVNGIDDIDVASADGADWDQLDARLLAQGVTTWCPTLVTADLSRYAASLDRIAAAMARPPAPRPTIAGVHLEGPFLGGAPGAHRRDQIVPVDLEWLGDIPGHVRIVTLAPESPGAAAATRLLVDRGVLVSLGHTTADEPTFDAAVDAGARLVTHLFNGMSGIHHREPGVAAFAVTDDRLSASLIADGVHVHPRVVAFAFRALGKERTVLVTDAVAWRSGRVGSIGIELRDGAPRLVDGTLAGSALTMDAAVRTAVNAGVPLDWALTAASTNPARIVGAADRGVIEPGRRADLVALTTDLTVEQVWVAGSPA